MRGERAAEQWPQLSFRAKRGICFPSDPKEKADSSGKQRPRNDRSGSFSASYEREKCRRADNMIFGIGKGSRPGRGALRGNLESARLIPFLREMSLHASDQSWVRLARGEVAASRHTPPTCKPFAKCRRADNMFFGSERTGAAKRHWIRHSLSWQRGMWSAGACSRFYGVQNVAQMNDWEVRLPSQKRRQAAALRNCRRADNFQKR